MNFSIQASDAIGLRSLFGNNKGFSSLLSRRGSLVYVSPDVGGSDFIRVVSPIMCNPLLEVDNKFCLRDLKLLNDGACDRISPKALKYGRLVFLVSRNKIDSVSLDALLEIKKRYGCKLIVDMDDDLFGISKEHPQYQEYLSELAKLRKLLRAADLLVSSTDEVAEGVRNEDLQVPAVVIPNYLDDRIWPLNMKAPSYTGGPIRILYSGTETHDGDLRLLEPLVPKIADRVFQLTGRNVEFHVVGGTTLDIPGLIVHKVPDEVRRYDRFVHWLLDTGKYHLAVAPLRLDNRLNHAKSNLKFLEYSAMGLPCVYSSIEPYFKTIEDGVDGYLIEDNDQDQWVERVCSLATNDRLRESMGIAAYTKLAKHYLLSDHMLEWNQMFH